MFMWPVCQKHVGACILNKELVQFSACVGSFCYFRFVFSGEYIIILVKSVCRGPFLVAVYGVIYSA
jgi:hypothetical protein